MIQTRVRSVTQRPDFSLSGQWDVVTMNRDGEEEKHVFDAVLVCSGLNTNPTFPLSGFPGQSTTSWYISIIKHIEGSKWNHLFLEWAHLIVFLCHCTICFPPGYETFTGRCFHSCEYKDAEALRGKRVVVVGMGNTAGDIAVEISRSSEKVRQKGAEKPCLQCFLTTYTWYWNSYGLWTNSVGFCNEVYP